MRTKSKGARKKRNLYRLGRAHEHAVRHLLEEQGYYVMRSAGSKGIWDLIAFQPGKATRLVQVKSRTLPSPEERRAMATCPTPTGWERELWIFLAHKPPKIIVVDTDAWYNLGRREPVAVMAAETGAPWTCGCGNTVTAEICTCGDHRPKEKARGK